MQTETLVGLIGFGGAVVGAGGALLGGWLQQHHQRQLAAEARLAVQAQEAAEMIMSALNEIDDLFQWRFLSGRGAAGWYADHKEDLFRCRSRMKQGALLIPNEQVRKHLKDVFELMLGWEVGDIDEYEQALRAQLAARDGLEILGSHLRGDPIPIPRFATIQARELRSRLMREDLAQDAEEGQGEPGVLLPDERHDVRQGSTRPAL
ncbi:hypothetical protein ACIPSE_01230 [Streptomyces sp. NPDC090106]|uniref:hypothetical protein n=1 Tax=Streptomyces sp. NPDC090106 TaxID=3365946 RepID=UPI00381B645E